jgi:glycosyltransferase involved in cell wall biosynthesis
MSKKNKKNNKSIETNLETNLVELVMIVKNSGEILRDCLLKNKKYVDYWTIVDTGSTDNTPDIIRETMKDIPGELHFSEFTTFAETRNKAFDLAQKKCKYMIVLDDSYEISNGDKMREHLQKSNADVIYCKIGLKREDAFLETYYSNRIIKTSSGIRYKYRVHEVPDELPKHKKDIVDKFSIIDHKNSYQNSRTRERYQNDICNLLLDKEDYPGNPRIIYYLAITYHALNEMKEAIRYNKMLLTMTSDDEYCFYAENSIITFENENKDIQLYRKKLQKLQKKYMNRAEPSYKLAVSYYQEGKEEELEKIMNNLIQCTTPTIIKTSLEHNIYDYSIPYLYCEIKCKLGKFKEVEPVLKHLLSIYPCDQKLLNMKYAICDNLTISSTRLAPKTLVIHTCNLNFYWNPNLEKAGKENNKISGSEYMAIYIAKEFRDLGYRVFIFGSFEDIDKKIDYQTTIEGIQYIDNSFFSDFCLKYIVDHLIVSRSVDNLVYYENVKSVYLWIHDVLPIGDFQMIQIHRDKFKGFICVSEWQKRNTIKHTKIDESYFYVSRNAIHPKRFIQYFLQHYESQKIPYRFIFTSDPVRGFSNVIEMIPWIKERYPHSTFYMFGKLEQVTKKDKEIIEILNKDTTFIYLHSRVSQEQLVKELRQSDVWLYPTCFEETYCISAVEAMASGCLVVTFAHAGLTEIVGDRGVLVNDLSNIKLFEELCNVLDDPKKKEEITEKGYQWAIQQDFHSLALDWKNNLFSK